MCCKRLVDEAGIDNIAGSFGECNRAMARLLAAMVGYTNSDSGSEPADGMFVAREPMVAVVGSSNWIDAGYIWRRVCGAKQRVVVAVDEWSLVAGESFTERQWMAVVDIGGVGGAGGVVATVV